MIEAGNDQQKKESKMLVLSRQRDESIMIGDEVEITIVDVRGDKVRLGINAPRRIAVHRKEIYEAIQREKAQNKEQQGSEEKVSDKKGDKPEDKTEKGQSGQEKTGSDSADT